MKCEILQKLDFACNRKLCKCVAAVETERVSQFWRQIQVRRLESFNFDSRIRRMRNFSKKFDFATNSRNPEKFKISEFSGNLIFFRKIIENTPFWFRIILFTVLEWIWCEALSGVGPKCKKSRPKVAGFNFELNHWCHDLFHCQPDPCFQTPEANTERPSQS